MRLFRNANGCGYKIKAENLRIAVDGELTALYFVQVSPTEGTNTEIQMTPKYEAALNVMREAQRAFDKITANFRAGKITADEYCAGRTVSRPP